MNRVTRPEDFRNVLRRGRRVATTHSIVHVLSRGTDEPTRFGFIVTKKVGGAVTRNLVRRRLRAICRDLVSDCPRGSDVVIRPLPGCDAVEWASLHSEISYGVDRGMAHS